MGKLRLDRFIVAAVETRVEFSNLKNSRTRIQEFLNRSGVGSETVPPAASALLPVRGHCPRLVVMDACCKVCRRYKE